MLVRFVSRNIYSRSSILLLYSIKKIKSSILHNPSSLVDRAKQRFVNFIDIFFCFFFLYVFNKQFLCLSNNNKKEKSITTFFVYIDSDGLDKRKKSLDRHRRFAALKKQFDHRLILLLFMSTFFFFNFTSGQQQTNDNKKKNNYGCNAHKRTCCRFE